MAAVRKIIEWSDVPLLGGDNKNPLRITRKKEVFNTKLPSQLLQYEPNQFGGRDRMVNYWNTHVCPSINNLYRITPHFAHNKDRMKRTIFVNGMKNILRDFNQRTDNIKVEFVVQEEEILLPKNTRWKMMTNNEKPTVRYSYSLKVMRLSNIPQSTQNARQFCLAEVPYRQSETMVVARAELIGTTTTVTDNDNAIITEVIDSNSNIDHYNNMQEDISSSMMMSPHVGIILNSHEDTSSSPVTTASLAILSNNNDNIVSLQTTRSPYHNYYNDEDHHSNDLLPLATCEMQMDV